MRKAQSSLESKGWDVGLRVIRYPEFLSIWSVGASLSILRWLEMLSVGVVVFDITASPLYVALMIILRFLPFIILGSLSGAISERINRRIGLIVMLSLMAIASLYFALKTVSGQITLPLIAISVLLNGLIWALDFPIRRTLFADVVPAGLLGIAMTLDSVTSNITRFLGPLIGGLFLEFVGIEGVFFLGAALYLIAALTMVFGTRIAGNRLSEMTGGFFSSLVTGLHVLRQERTLLGVMAVTVIFNVWGFPFFSMIPIIGKEVLGLSPLPLGLLVSAEGLGALTGALLIVALAKVQFYRKLYTYGVFLTLVMAFAFSQASNFLSATLFLFLTGLGAGFFAAMQSTLVMFCTPLEARGRMMGLLTVFIGISTLGFLHIGILAKWLGAESAIVVCTVEGLLMLLLVCRVWPEVLAPQLLPADS